MDCCFTAEQTGGRRHDSYCAATGRCLHVSTDRVECSKPAGHAGAHGRA